MVELLFPEKRASACSIALPDSFPLVCAFNEKLAHAVEDAVNRGLFPLVIGGDHSIAAGTWKGVRQAVRKPLGLLWIDAHMDAHVPETSPSGAWHGMPLAALMGYGKEEWAAPVLRPEHVALVGVRSYEDGEAALLDALRVRVYKIEEVRRKGLKSVLEEATARVSQAAGGFGVSLDLDVIDPSEAPGVGSPEPGGVSAAELIRALAGMRRKEALRGLEIVEYNPQRDVQRKTFSLVAPLAEALLGGG
jgi:arginase